MARLDGKIAFVTGGGSGLGEAISLRLAEEGAKIAVADISLQKARSVASSIAENGGKALAVELDVRNEKRWKLAIGSAMRELGPIDVLVNNAGIAMLASIEDARLDDWRNILAVNLDGVFLGTKFAIEAMKEHGGGSVINMASIRSRVGDPNSIAYDASKGGVEALTRSAALHCANNRYGIRVNSVHPAYVLTDMFKGATAHLPDADALLEQVKAAHPIGRMGTAREVADAVLYLASDESSFVTGSAMIVDGGFTAQ